MSSSPRRVRAVFWLLQAPDSLTVQSRRDPDGTGLGYFAADGTPQLHKAPIAAWQDRVFAEEAREVESSTFIAHVRYASTGPLSGPNTHPFLHQGKLFAHNGVIERLDRLEKELGGGMGMVRGETDSERFFALVLEKAAAHGGDLGAGIAQAARWVASNLPVYALNLVLTTAGELWALRYPATHELYVLQRATGGRHGNRHLDHTGTGGRLRVHSDDLAAAPSVVVASERLDDNPDWRLLRPGELLHVGPELQVSCRMALPQPPAHPLVLADLRPQAAASQTA